MKINDISKDVESENLLEKWLEFREENTHLCTLMYFLLLIYNNMNNNLSNFICIYK